ncbi:MAG: hypothetical protein ACO3R6_04215 [Lutimaribacter sp.]
MPTLVISHLYLASYWVTTWASNFTIASDNGVFATASLFFMPHGVRVIAAWLYGWRSVLILIPGTYAAHFLRVGSWSMSWAEFVRPMFGVSCAAFCFWLLARLCADWRLRPGFVANWKDVLLAGSLAAVVNAVGSNLLFGNGWPVVAGYFFGDIIGMLALFGVLMLVFRALRMMHFRADRGEN